MYTGSFRQMTPISGKPVLSTEKKKKSLFFIVRKYAQNFIVYHQLRLLTSLKLLYLLCFALKSALCAKSECLLQLASKFFVYLNSDA